jgi:hypothetical protein
MPQGLGRSDLEAGLIAGLQLSGLFVLVRRGVDGADGMYDMFSVNDIRRAAVVRGVEGSTRWQLVAFSDL